jgi:hypothetical protein
VSVPFSQPATSPNQLMKPNLNVTRLQIPDGHGDVTLLTIEGGDSAGTARLLANHYLGQASPVTSLPSANDEEVLEMPSMNFDRKPKAPVISQEEANNEEEVLPLPVLNFGRKAA